MTAGDTTGWGRRLSRGACSDAKFPKMPPPPPTNKQRPPLPPSRVVNLLF